MDIPSGRKMIIECLIELMLGRQAVLLYGPVGIGKTCILETIRQAVAEMHKPWGFAGKTWTLSDLTNALLMAYPCAREEGMSQHQVRSALRAAIDGNPGVLFLDHVHNPGAQFKGLLRKLRYDGMGMLIAADSEGPEDHARLRSMHITWREAAVHPLPNRHIRHIFKNLISDRPLPGLLKSSDREALVKMAQGRPGWMHMISDRLQKSEFWCNGDVLLANMRISIMMEVAAMYIEPVGDFSF
jgi:hypothetical protein